MLVGIVLETLGWAMHRAYWGIWRTYRLYGNESMDLWMTENGYLALVPVVFILGGMILIIGPIFSFVIKKSRAVCYGIATVLVFSILWFMYWQLGDAFDADKLRKQSQQQVTVVDKD
jgi:low temperature requirement protein LtrA